MKEPLKVLDIFSGIGGFSIGLENAGMETAAFCEIEPFAQDILNKHWPHTRIFTDIRTLNEESLLRCGISKINVIAGGFPCQDISCAGKQVGIDGSRSGLWKEFWRLIDELRPDYAIIENVANLRSRGLITVLQDLRQIGYNAQWHCIPASAIGAPHRRDRIWIIAYPYNSRNRTSEHDYKKWSETCQEREYSFNRPCGQSENLAHPHGKSYNGLPGRKTQAYSLSGIGSENISDTNDTGCEHNKSTSAGENDTQGWQECSADSVLSGNITAGDGLSLHKTGSGKETKSARLQNGKAILADSDSTRALGIRGADNNASQKGGSRRINGAGSRSHDRGQHQSTENEKMANPDSKRLQGYGGFETACQILTQEEIGMFCRSRGTGQWGIEPDIPRLKDGRLNPDWVEWLMGFPTGWTSGGSRKKRLVALGNAVVPFIPELIGNAIIKWQT